MNIRPSAAIRKNYNDISNLCNAEAARGIIGGGRG